MSNVTQRKDPSIGTDFQEYLRRDPRSRGEVLAASPPREAGSTYASVSSERYTSREFHEREKARLWPRIWQMACREQDIPQAGDYTLYEIIDQSFLLVRQQDGTIKAFYNSCLHRGRMLVTHPGSSQQFRCPFHGFTWAIDGRLKEIPCRWDFPDVKDEHCALPEARVESWGGWCS